MRHPVGSRRSNRTTHSDRSTLVLEDRGTHARWNTRHVSVPDSDQLIEYADLDDIDPRTLKTKDYGEDSWQSWFDQHASQLKGPAGPKGDRGEKGEHGNRITIGTGAPGEPSADGIDGDVYIDAATGDLYQIQNQ